MDKNNTLFDVTIPLFVRFPGSVVAFDPDSGENGTVVYRLQQTHPLFVLTANGDVLIRRILTDSDPIDYRLSIIAADQGIPRKSAVCHVPIKVTSGISLIKMEEPFERYDFILIPPVKHRAAC